LVRDAKHLIDGLLLAEAATPELPEVRRPDQESEGLYRALVELSPGALLVHRHGTLLYVNPAAVELFGGTSTTDFVGKSIVEIVHPDFYQPAVARKDGAAGPDGTSEPIEIRILTLDGTPRDVRIESRTIVYDGEPAVLGALGDITERKAHGIEIERLSRLYTARSKVNQAIVRMPSRNELFQNVCGILVDHGGMRVARIGWHISATRELIDVAAAGDLDHFPLQRVKIASADAPQSPTRTAFREERPYVCNDVFNDSMAISWRDSIIGREFRSCAAFPFREKGVVSGVLSVYAIEPDFFRDKEIELLTEAADDISFGLDNLVRETERQRAGVVALDSEKEAKDLGDAINEHALVAVTDPRGRITFVNDRFCEVSGYSRKDLIGQDHLQIGSVSHSSELIQNLWETLRAGNAWHGELRSRTKSGSEYWVDTTIVPSLHGDGTARQYMTIRTVITARKEAELAVRVERDRAQKYLDTAEAILLALDLEGRITLVNRYACAVFGWTAEELLGRDFMETCIPAAIREETIRRFHKVLSGPVSSIVENPIVTKSGEIRVIEWRNTLVRDAEGRVTSTLSSGIDLTDRNAAIDALRTAEERMRFALQAANVGIWDMDYTTGVLEWSDTIARQYGLAPGAFDGKFETFVAMVHPDDRALTLETVATAMKLGSDFTTSHRVLWPDGTVRRLSGAGRILLNENGEPNRGIGISLDITERHSLEEQFQQAQKMEAIGRLAGGVAHDFNNLLTAILGYCELLLSDFGPDDPRHSDIAEIQKAGMSAAGLTRQLLAFSRKQIIELTLMDLNEIVATMRGILGRLIGEDVTIELVLMPEKALVKADRGQLEQLVMNLAVNARDAMKNGGVLTLETACVDIDEHYEKTHFSVKTGRYVMLTVSDTGSGMTPEVKSRLFEPFFTTKEVGKGTGLGLATVHGIVTRAGGAVNVYTEVGMGTSFKVYLPRVDADEGATLETPVPATSARTGSQTVLVVEDAEGLRELARRLLERLGYNVLVAANAADALRVFEEVPSIDVLLTDVVMPGGSGPDLSRELVERRPTLKVVYMSGYTDEAIVHHGVLNPGIALLNKPFTSEALSRKIREVLK